jgi:hypothetical protein
MDNSDRVRPADAGGRVWHALDAAGNQIGACSSREDALRIAALAGGAAAPPRGEETGRAGPELGQGGLVTPETRPSMFEWYSADLRPSAWARLRDLCSRARGLSRGSGRAR